MRDRFIGDSLDMSKRALVTTLQNQPLCFLTCPLPAEKQFNAQLYRKVLALREGDHLFHPNGVPFRGPHRRRHLEMLRTSLKSGEFCDVSVVLLDPDKGICQSKGGNEFLLVSEVKELADLRESLPVAVYHHKNAGGISYASLLMFAEVM